MLREHKVSQSVRQQIHGEAMFRKGEGKNLVERRSRKLLQVAVGAAEPDGADPMQYV